MTIKQGKGFAGGKLILSGEHSVVYGAPAVVTALDAGIKVRVTSQLSTEKDQKDTRTQTAYLSRILDIFSEEFELDTKSLSIFTESQLSSRSGLGSSAAFATATFQALADYFSCTLTSEKVYQLTFEAEKYVHGTPSGIDPFAVVYGGTHVFQKQSAGFTKKLVRCQKPYTFLAINSGKATESTGQMVAQVAKRHKKEDLSQLFAYMAKTTKQLATSFADGTFSGDVLAQNQAYLEELGVVGRKAKNMISEIKKQGAYAKITGAGGVATGSGWILAYAPNLESLVAFAKQKGWETFTSTVQ